MLTIYGYDSSIHRCVHCDNAKRLAEVKREMYEFRNVMPEKGVFDDEVIAELLTRLGRDTQIGLTMPQIFDGNGAHIGGFTELREYFK
ncbi:phage-associated thioredoxin [Citrobacter phage CF1 ERZ-2017]|uniref:Thioredoxin n=2 Tax=Moonvirus TaxID=1985329 RepID=A0A0K1LMI8_9CAUD|nr:phage-associated thioredoxin [Citrobacter phage Merlin]YP_009618143.1 phage-associated thioredoxin [Citrobacter phage CF1 ERZ-2017]AKU43731.1 thioredoxin [Citrobacter phage Merlin]AUE22957.1 thioredoxin [Citrobacter phage CF1 ERZ-2017]